MMNKKVSVIGAGFAGSEAAYQLAKRGFMVDLIEMRPIKMTPAHKSDKFAELVCSNSFRSNSMVNGVGVLKQELRELDSLIMQVADKHAVPAGSALAVDRENFSNEVTELIKNNPNINVINQELVEIMDGPVIIATGPLTSPALSESIKSILEQDTFYFYDAAAPIIEKDSIDFSKAYYKSRYDKGDADYINCPMTKDEFYHFYRELITAKTTELKEFEKEIYFEGCMPFEEMAKRGDKTLLFGPMKPVGLEQDGGKRPYAVVQLRQDNAIASLYNVVGFQTHLTWGEQKRILSLIPGLENCNVVRYGVMHRNTYINSPIVLNPTYQSKNNPNIFFAGQMSGVEGYIESCASGMLAAINMAKHLNNEPLITLPNTCMIGAMAHYITHADKKNFQPMNANFGIMALRTKVAKNERKQAFGIQAIEVIKEFKEKL